MSLLGVGWLKAIRDSASLDELRQSVVETAEQLGFKFFLYRARFPNPKPGGREFHLENCPEEWRREAVRSDVALDPLYRRALREVAPIFWRELVLHEADWIARARKFGLASGVTLPIHGPDGRWSSLSLIKNRCGASAERDLRTATSKGYLLAVFIHEAIDRILKNQVGLPGADCCGAMTWGLTERERECLTWIAAGKTTAETASALSVSQRTIVFHLANARRKLGVANSHHAIMRAVSLGHIKAA